MVVDRVGGGVGGSRSEGGVGFEGGVRPAAPGGLVGLGSVLSYSTASAAFEDDGAGRELLRRGRGREACFAGDGDWRRSRGRVVGPKQTETEAGRPLLTPSSATAAPRARSRYGRRSHLALSFRSPAVSSALLLFCGCTRPSPVWAISLDLYACPLPSIIVVKVDVGLAQKALCFGELLRRGCASRRAQTRRGHRRTKIVVLLMVESSWARCRSRCLRRRRRSCSARRGGLRRRRDRDGGSADGPCRRVVTMRKGESGICILRVPCRGGEGIERGIGIRSKPRGLSGWRGWSQARAGGCGRWRRGCRSVSRRGGVAWS